MLGDRVGELLAVAGRTVEVHLGEDEAAPPGGEHLVIPPRTPAVGPRTLRAAVNQIDERILARGVEARRLLGPTENRVAQCADEPEFLERRKVERREGGIVVMCQRLARNPDLRRLGVALMEIREGAIVRS